MQALWPWWQLTRAPWLRQSVRCLGLFPLLFPQCHCVPFSFHNLHKITYSKNIKLWNCVRWTRNSLTSFQATGECQVLSHRHLGWGDFAFRNFFRLTSWDTEHQYQSSGHPPKAPNLGGVAQVRLRGHPGTSWSCFFWAPRAISCATHSLSRKSTQCLRTVARFHDSGDSSWHTGWCQTILSDNDDHNSLLQSLWPWLLAFSFQHWLVPSCCRVLFFRLTPGKQQFIWVFKMGGRLRYLFIFVLVWVFLPV